MTPMLSRARVRGWMLFGTERRRQIRQASRVGAVGLEMAIATLIGALGGGWLDERFSTRPWLTTVGLVLGIAAGFRGLVRTVTEHERRMRRERAAEECSGRAPDAAQGKKQPSGRRARDENPDR